MAGATLLPLFAEYEASKMKEEGDLYSEQKKNLIIITYHFDVYYDK